MAKIIWISSYPKSGSTWVRFIIANLVSSNVSSSGDVFRLIPDIHKGIHSDHLLRKENIFIKSHLKYFDDMPLREDTIGIIHIVRNPLDVIASAINHFAFRDSKKYFEASEDQRIEIRQSLIKEFLEKGGPDRWVRLGAGTWPEHVLSWHREDLPFPLITLKFEDLKTHPTECVTRLCEFLQIEPTTEQIEAALAASSFENMREMEEKEVAQGQAGIFSIANPTHAFSHGLRFMNKGMTGVYRELLTDAQVGAATERFGPVMRQFGY